MCAVLSLKKYFSRSNLEAYIKLAAVSNRITLYRVVLFHMVSLN